MTNTEINKQLETLSDHKKMMVLLNYGHQLTISARDGYEVQGNSLTKPKLLREINEIMHRLFSAAQEIEKESTQKFSLSSISNWISCEDRDQYLQKMSVNCFKRALKNCV